MAKKLYYEEYGTGRPIILLHAFPLSSSMWKAQAEFLSSKNWRVITPDFPGFGDSGIDSDVSRMEDLAQSVATLFSQLNIERAILGGLSMGGYVALNFVRMFADKVEALILADTNAAADTAEKRQSRIELVQGIKEKGSDALIDEMLPNLISNFAKKNNPDLVERLENVFKKANDRGVMAALLGMAERQDHVEKLKDIDKPTLLIFGEDDKITNLEAAMILKDNIPNAELITIPDVGHYSNLENPSAFNNAMADFLNRF